MLGEVKMDKYLVTYEYKEKDGSLILTKTKTEVLTAEILEKGIKYIDSHDDYLKILFCQKLQGGNKMTSEELGNLTPNE